MRNLMSILHLNRAKKGRLDNMKVYLVPTREVYIQKCGALKAKEVIPFLRRAISLQGTIMKISSAIKNTGCH